MTHQHSNIKNRHKGFSLFELLVVIIIISITFSVFLTINFSFATVEEKIHKEASRLYLLLSFAHEQSVIRAEEYGIEFHPKGYRFLQYINEEEAWTDIDDKLLTEKTLEDEIELELSVEQTEIVLDEISERADEDNPENKIKPQVFLLSSGELTPDFIARFYIPGVDTSFEVHGNIDGKYELKESE